MKKLSARVVRAARSAPSATRWAVAIVPSPGTVENVQYSRASVTVIAPRVSTSSVASGMSYRPLPLGAGLWVMAGMPPPSVPATLVIRAVWVLQLRRTTMRS